MIIKFYLYELKRKPLIKFTIIPKIIVKIIVTNIKFLIFSFFSSIRIFCPMRNSVHGNKFLLIFLILDNDIVIHIPQVHILIIEICTKLTGNIIFLH